jgi:hypothetical protein
VEDVDDRAGHRLACRVRRVLARPTALEGVRLVKLFLNVSKETQRIRFVKPIDLPEKNWKFSASDARERQYWDDYQRAYSKMLTHTSTEWAPWHVLPPTTSGSPGSAPQRLSRKRSSRSTRDTRSSMKPPAGTPAGKD